MCIKWATFLWRAVFSTLSYFKSMVCEYFGASHHLREFPGTTQDSLRRLFQKELYVALPVTAPSLAGFLLTVFTEKPSGPVTSTSTTW